MMQHTFQLGITTLFIALSAHQVSAAGNTSEQDFLQEFPVVLSASRLSQPLSEAPNAMTVIDRKMIVSSGFRSLPDLFKLVPGMYVSYYKGSQAIVSYHGTFSQDAQGMQVLIDGRSVYMPPFNKVDWSLLPVTLDDIERIEVIRGPAAASYGENSTHGVINIITRDTGTFERAVISGAHGTKGINDVAVHFGKQGAKLDQSLTLGYQADNGYDDLTVPPNNIPQADALLNNSNDSNQGRLLNYRAAFHRNSEDDYELKLGFKHDVQGVGFKDSHGGFNPFHDMISDSNFQQFDWTRRKGNASEMRLRYSHSQLSTDENYQVSNNPLAHSINSRRHEIEFQHSLHTAENNRLVYGAGYRQDHVDVRILFQPISPGNFSLLNDATVYRVFANDEWRFSPKLLFNLGGMLEQDAMQFTSFSPRVSLNYHFKPSHTIRTGVSVAHRTPALAEQLGSVLVPIPGLSSPSPGLSPEKITSREIGYLGEFHNLGTSLDLRIFNDQIDNVIFPNANNAWSNGLVGSYEGLEATFKHTLDAYSDLMVNYAHELAHSNIKVLMNVPSDNLALSIPKSNASLLYSRRMDNDFSFSAGYFMQTALQPFDRGEIDFQPTQHRADIRLSKKFNGFGGYRGDVTGVVQNLFNTDYTEYLATALFNRRAYVKLTLNL